MRKIAQRLSKVSTPANSSLAGDISEKQAKEGFFLPLEHLLRGRSRVAPRKIQELLENARDEKALEIDESRRAKLKFDDGRSFEGLKDAIEVARLRDGFVFIGKPEKIYLSILLGAQTIPVKVTHDLRDRSNVDAWTFLKAEGLVFLPELPKDLATNPPRLAEIKDKEKVPTPDEIIGRIERNLRKVAFTGDVPAKYMNHGISSEFYLPIEYMMRGQGFISADNIYRKAKENFEKGGFSVGDDRFEVQERAWDGGKSSRNLEDKPVKTRVVKTVEGYIIVDGHHEAYSAILVESKTVPVIVVDDFTKSNKGRDWTMVEVWAELQRTQKTLFLEENPHDLARSRPTLRGMLDNPNRYLARLLSMKVLTEKTGEGGLVEIALAATRGVEAPVWIKVDEGIEMIEFHIANILSEADISYLSKWGDRIPEDVIEKSRQALILAQKGAVDRARGKSLESLSARDQILLKIPPIIESHQRAQALLRKENLADLVQWIADYIPARLRSKLSCQSLLAK